ncbi:hypothetical protein [Sphaerochaeta globosa]|uniref:YubB ferredoxin-like domain-containing protein n=1 Tax=Sphaerochaeta globosa (strain ATCC BAA-1886 / DSM 22777 / Buddy) TaxID=158189 RepID=F0RTH6_SPHGB|nr:hypothetical protein [Sphaerochaeta globosa]ADY14171.1 hypothetical protein SpiBuddy_2356 [Sphaerochaeta globosa str. Buddy]
MPNWIKTFIKLKGKKDELDMLESMMTYRYAGENDDKEQNFFNSLVPMPCKLPALEWLYEHWGTCTEAEELWFCRNEAELLELAFETAWTTPKEIFAAITKQFPSITLGGYYADENLGDNCGLIVGSLNRVETIKMGDESDAAVQFSEKVWDVNVKEFFL